MKILLKLINEAFLFLFFLSITTGVTWLCGQTFQVLVVHDHLKVPVILLTTQGFWRDAKKTQDS